MLLLDEDNAEPYLREHGWIDPTEPVRIRALTGGVSNQVLLIERPNRPAERFVVKQAREQLRVAEPWFCSLDRIWREVAVLEAAAELLLIELQDGQGSVVGVKVPKVLAIDRENFAFAMTAAPAAHCVWKQQLLAGEADVEIAKSCGRMLGMLHGRSWNNEQFNSELHDRSIFVELRIDPYYRHIARRFPDSARPIDSLIDQTLGLRKSLVHADFSPKNLLVFNEGDYQGLILVDFETGHFGDPAFDLGFFLSHLVLKAVYHAPRVSEIRTLIDQFLREYETMILPWLERDELNTLKQRGAAHLSACLWARIDGKSPVEYLQNDARKELVRKLARQALHDRVGVADVIDSFAGAAASLSPILN